MKRYYLCAVLLITAGVFFVGCELTAKVNPNTADPNQNIPSVSFENFTTRSVLVKNETGQRLVAFKGTISPETLISGVPAHASNHGLKRDTVLFSETGDFALRFITEKQYIANKNNLKSLDNAAFASIYAFYNKDGDNNNVYTISSKTGGSSKLILFNNSSFNVELRKDSPNGTVIGYVAANTANTALYLEPGDYTVFPIFKKYLKRDNEIYSVAAKRKSDQKLYYKSLNLEDKGKVEWNVGELWNPATLDLSAGGCYITVNNQSQTGLKVRNGDEPMAVSPTGANIINSGKAITFFFPFAKSADGKFPETKFFGALKIGDVLDLKPVPECTLKCNYKYTIKVTGQDAGDVKCEFVNSATGEASEDQANPDGDAVDIKKLYDLQ